MATSDHVENMYDVKLKPRLLRSLMVDHLPDQNHSFPDNADLSIVVRDVNTFRLLSESVAQGVDAEVIEDWKLAVDEWVERLMLLASSEMVGKSWAGSILLGLTCLECSSNRFLSSYSVWFNELLSHIQPPSDYESVNVASCASISNLLARLGEYSNLNKDGTSYSRKLIQPVLKLLEEDCSEAVLEGAVDLLCTIINFFPSSIRRKYESAQAAIVSNIISGRCSVNILKKYAHCLALLPKSRGDEDSWSETMQKILISIDVLLNEASEGLEEETNCFGAISILIPPGEDPLDPVGGLTMSDILSNLARIRSKQLLISSVPTLTLCCCIMLTNPYPVQVTVPVCPLLTLVGRVLMADGSLCQGLLPFTTILQQESICFALPILHLYSLDLLTAIIKGVHSQLLPHAAEIVQLLMEYFRRCALPTLRIKVYSIIRMLLISMGVGIALCIAQEVVSNAFVDLDSVAYGNGRESSSEYSNPEAQLQPSNRERKQDTMAGSLGEDLDGVGLEVEILKEDPTLTSLKIAALESLEALLTVGGALKCEHLRSDVDLLLINVATNAFDVEWTSDEDSDFLTLNEPTSSSIELQLAALRALLASLLSPASVWPRYLNQGLELFRKGKQEMGTKIAEFCAHALLVLELLMRPRYLSMMDSPPASQSYLNEGINHGVSENLCSGGQENAAPVSTPPGVDNLPDPDHNLYDSWLGNSNKTDASLSNPNENIQNTEGLSKTDVQQAIKDFHAENCPMDCSSSVKIPEENKQGQEVSIDMEMGRNNDAINVEPEKFLDPMSVKDIKVPIETCTGSEFKGRKEVLDSGAFDSTSNEVTLSKDVLADFDDDIKTGKDTFTLVPVSGKAEGLLSVSDNKSSMDSISIIVDEDPDSSKKAGERNSD